MKLQQRLIFSALAIAAATSCAIAVAPDPSSGLGPPATVTSPLADEAIGTLFPTSDGTWAFIPRELARSKAFKPGQIAAFGEDPEDPRNLFGVVEVTPWGVSLQRLDAEPPSDARGGVLVPLAQGDADTVAQWGYCIGSGPLADSSCVAKFSASTGGTLGDGRRWSIYPTDRDGVLKIDAKPSSSPTLPIHLVAQVYRGELGESSVGGELPAHWLAVPTMAQVARPTTPRIAVAPSCSASNGWDIGLAGKSNADWFKAEITPPKNTVQVSSEAVRLGADALVWCDGQDVRVAVPALFRPRIAVSGRDFDAPPLLGAKIHTVGKRNADAVGTIARLGGAVSTGDWASADVLAEQLVRTFGSTRPVETIAVDTMTAVAEARPEAAARLGQWATRQQWNQANSAAWQLGTSRVEANLGKRKESITRTADIVDVLQRGDSDARVFMTYFGLRPRLTAGARGRDATNALVDAPELQLLARAVRSLDAPNFATLSSEFADAGATPLFEAMAGTIAPLRCDANACAGDVYGRLWASGTLPAAALTAVGRVDLRPGYRGAATSAELPPLDQLAAHVALAPLLDEEDAARNEEQATAALVAWAHGDCAGDTATVRAIGRESARRADEDDARLLRWATSSALDAACADAAALTAAVGELGEVAGRNDAPLALWEHKIAQSTTNTLAVVEGAAAFASTHERGERCATWTTALAAGYLQAQRADRARHWVEQSLRCDVEDRSDIEFLAAFLNFQHTTTTLADFGPQTRQRLRHAVHTTPTSSCIGLDPIGYDVAQDLPDATRAIIARLDIPAAPPSSELTLVTANDRLRHAREDMAKLVAQLDAREFVQASETLGHALATFQSLSHEVGIARVRWVDEVVFGAKARDIARGELTFNEVGHAALRRDGVFSAREEPELRAAAALLQTTDAATLPSLQQWPARATLCELAPRETPGLVLDTVDGKLKDVRNIGELEVELAPPHERPLP